jgi:hypothetical protein
MDAFSHWLGNPETDHLASAERYGWRLVDCEQVLNPVACTEFGELVTAETNCSGPESKDRILLLLSNQHAL